MFVTPQQLEKQMPDATRLLSDEPEMEDEMGKVFTKLTVINRADQILTENGIIPPEQAQAAQQQAQASQQRVTEVELSLEQERQRVAQLAQQLRSLGVDPDNLG